MTAPSDGDLRKEYLANRAVPHMRKNLIECQVTPPLRLPPRERRMLAFTAGARHALADGAEPPADERRCQVPLCRPFRRHWWTAYRIREHWRQMLVHQPPVHPGLRAVSNPAAAMSVRLLSLSQSSGSPSKSQLRTAQQPAGPTCLQQTLSIRVIEDHRSVLVPSSTSSLWMLNQLRLAASHHNRDINHRICLTCDLRIELVQLLRGKPRPLRLKARGQG